MSMVLQFRYMFQEIVNQAYRKQVVVEPLDGACGVDKTRSQIEIPGDNFQPEYEYEFPDYKNDFKPQVIIYFSMSNSDATF